MLLEEWDRFINKVRGFFKDRGYVEVSTPVLLDFPNLDRNVQPIPVKVRIRGAEKTKWLQTSPEYSMKKLLAKYKRHMFQIAKVFRNDEWGRLHRLEFHMLEWYRVGEDYTYLMNETREFLSAVLGYRDFEDITVEEAFRRKFGRSVPANKEELVEILEKNSLNYEPDEDWETLFYRAFIEVERELGRDKPTFLRDFPPQLCALAKVKGKVAERFELFVEGIELANGWTEETDPREIRKRLMREASERKLPIDEEFIKAHEGMPPCAGCSIGLDRLFMLYMRKSSLKDIELLA